MKYALIIGNDRYDDPKLAQLKTPAADSQALARILGDASIGSFDEVTPLINQSETKVRRAISQFLAGKKPDDLVLLYFSGHGVLDDRGRLYLALKDTLVSLLKATSIPSSFIAETPRQVPHKWSYHQQGDLVIARNPFLKKKVPELPYELVQALESSFVGIRESAVNELGKYLHSHEPEMVELARAALKRMESDDSRRISYLAGTLLAGPGEALPSSAVTAAETPASRGEAASVRLPMESTVPEAGGLQEARASAVW